ncbi:MAG: homoserine dehydrogenase [Anaerolineae bacterium]|jgi:homoserine dehydrogenase|nr:homoserine dehydrogenase [Anaerolineae bacterium]
MHIRIAMLGYGNVARALARLLLRKTDILQKDYDLTFSVTGIATRSRGYAINPDGLDLEAALQVVDSGGKLDTLHRGEPVSDTLSFIDACPADAIMEATWLDPQTGQPATDYARAALRGGRHFITANKGPVAYAYRELSELARQQDRGFFFESTVMDGAPVLGIGREALLATTVQRIRGILNSTTNYILTCMEDGISLDAAVAQAQQIGVVESEPGTDIDGWDAAVKIVVLANVLMGADLRPGDVDCTGIAELSIADVQGALKAGERYKLLCEAAREGDTIQASVKPVRLPLSDPLSQIGRTSSAVTFETDTLHHLTVVEGDTDPTTTAFGMLVDMINIARGRYR